MRKVVIEMILTTDMQKHFDSLCYFKQKALSIPKQFELNNMENKLLVLKMGLKCADISHSSKD